MKTPTNKKALTERRSRTVRKTITLDGDLAKEVSSVVMEKGSSEKIVINNLIRLGLIHEKQQAELKKSDFRLPSFPKGIGNLSRRDLNSMLDEI